MTITNVKLAESLGVTPSCITKVKKRLGITGETLTKDEIDAITEHIQQNTLDRDKEFNERIESTPEFITNVRRINETDDSSLKAMLLDCKDHYVQNEELIQRLQHEIGNKTSLLQLNGNRTVSADPLLKPLESFQKVNITLRNQIVALEAELGKVPNVEADDPFE